MSDPDETSVVRGSFSVRDRLLLTGLLALGVAAMFAAGILRMEPLVAPWLVLLFSLGGGLCLGVARREEAPR